MSHVTFRVGAVWTQVRTEHEEVIQRLVEWGSYTAPHARFTKAYQRHHWDGKYHVFSLRDRSFPSGLVESATAWLTAAGLIPRIRYSFVPPGPDLASTPVFEGLTWRPGQYKAIKHAQRSSRGIFNMTTATGKTEVIAAILRMYSSRRALVLMDDRDLFQQTASRLTGRLRQSIGMVGDPFWEIRQVTVGMVPTLATRLFNDKWRDEVLELLESIELLIVDEVHHAAAKTFLRVLSLCTNATIRYGFSATAFDKKMLGPRPRTFEDAKIVGYIGPLIFDYKKYQVAVKVKRLVVQLHGMSMVPYDIAYKSGILGNHKLNMTYAACIRGWVAQGKSVLTLVSKKKHGALLAKWSGSMWLHGGHTRTYRAKARYGFNRKSLKSVVTTLWREGIDLPAIDVLVLADPGKKGRPIIQQVGRAARSREDKTEVLVLDAKIVGNEAIEKQGKARGKVFKEEGFSVEEIPLDRVDTLK